MRLDREGIFMARPLSWGVKQSTQSQSVAIVMDFIIGAQLVDGEWESWADYEEQTITGYFYVVKADGSINTTSVDRLALSIGWNGNLEFGVPECNVQITVKMETDARNGRQMLKVAWINPGDYTPQPQTTTPETIKSLTAQYGSLLRAAAAAKLPKPAPKPKQEKPSPATNEDTADLPF